MVAVYVKVCYFFFFPYRDDILFFMKAGMTTYERSLQECKIPVQPSLTSQKLAAKLILISDNRLERERIGQQLLASLCVTARISCPVLHVQNVLQVHEMRDGKLSSKIYGYYQCRNAGRGVVLEPEIFIYHRTAILGKPISGKVFLHTLLHEWCHHYDLAKLQLEKSYHTKGFYTRLRKLGDVLFKNAH